MRGPVLRPESRQGRESLARALPRYNSAPVPELPDLTVVAEAFHAALAGRPVTRVAAPGPLAVRGTPAEQDLLVGQTVVEIRRRGKFLILRLDRDTVVFNPM